MNCKESIKIAKIYQKFIFFVLFLGVNHFVFAQKSENFLPFTAPKTSVKIKNFEVMEAFQIGKKKIVSGHYIYDAENEKFTPPDNESDYGRRILVLDEKNQVEFRSKGAMDTMGLQLFFYKNNKGKIIILRTLAFEYQIGGDAFLFENDKVKEIGYMDISPTEEEVAFEKIIKITEKNQQIIFSFTAPKLILNPGGKNEKIVKNNNIHYIFENGKLTLYPKNILQK